MKNEQRFASVAGNLFIWFFGLSRVCGSMNDRKLGSGLGIIHRERGWEGCPLRSVLVLSPGEILPLRLTFHPTRYIVRDEALLSSFRGIALI